jgi:hypothetical protein
MSAANIDHATHGWALLAFKLPEIRPFTRERKVRAALEEMCQHYSIGVLRIRELRLAHNTVSVDLYERQLSDIEREISLFIKGYTQQ